MFFGTTIGECAAGDYALDLTTVFLGIMALGSEFGTVDIVVCPCAS